MGKHFRLSLVITGIILFWNCKSNSEETETKTDEQRTEIEMVTNYGSMTLELYNETPLHRDNFIKLVNKKVYDSLLFHRVIENFMIQGGDPDSKNAKSDAVLGNGDLEYTVDAEFDPNLFHKKGALATARIESPSRASSAVQFFIVQGKTFNDSLLDKAETRINSMLARHYIINDSVTKSLWIDLGKAYEEENEKKATLLNDSINTLAKLYTNFERYKIPEVHRKVYKSTGGTPHLDQNYTVFGQVIDGLKVIDSIAASKTDENDRPLSEVRILSMKIK